MTYFKSVLAGLAAAVMAIAAWAGLETVFPLPQITYVSMAGNEGGGIGAATTGSYGPFVGIAAFALGFYIMFRRLRLRYIGRSVFKA